MMQTKPFKLSDVLKDEESLQAFADQVRRDALEEAVRACEALDVGSAYDSAHYAACAAAIRSLIDQAPS